MKSTDFIKISGLQSTPGAGANLHYWEVFEGRGVDVSGAGTSANVTVNPGNETTTPGTPNLDDLQQWVKEANDQIDGVDEWVDSVATQADGGTVPTLPDPQTPDITDILGSIIGAGSGSIITYIVLKLAVRLIANWLRRRAGDDKQNQQAVVAALNAIKEEQAALRAYLQNGKLTESVADMDKQLADLTKYIKDEDLVQAIRDLLYNDREMNIPGTNHYVQDTGKFIRKNA